MWKKIKEAFFNWFFLVLFTLMAIALIFTSVTNMSGIWETNEEKVVEETYTNKGLYFGLQNYAHLSDGSKHRIRKSDFLSLEKGDTFHVFFNQISMKDFLLLTTIVLLFLCGLLAMIYMFAHEIFGHTRWFQWIDKTKEQVMKIITAPFKRNKKALDILKQMVMIAFILSLSIALLLVAKNVVYKVLPFGKTDTIAEVLDHEKSRSFNPKGPGITTYTLTYQYTDKNGERYKTEKNVSSATYNFYKDKRFIPILYRSNVPYDTFIDNRSLGEFLSPVLSVPTFIYAFIGYLLYFLVKKYIETWGIPFTRHYKKY